MPLGGLTSIFCNSSVIGGGASAPDLPPPLPLSPVDCAAAAAAADDREERLLGFIIGFGNLRARLRASDGDEKRGREKNKGFR